MLKTLSQIKPHEKETLEALGNPKRQVFLALVDEDMHMAFAASQQIKQLKTEHKQNLLQEELQRQHLETLKLAEADHLQLDHVNRVLDKQQHEVEERCQTELENLLEYQSLELRRLEQKLASQIITKSQSPQYLALEKEYKKLIVLKLFDKAEETQKIMRTTENENIKQLEERNMIRNMLKIEQLRQKHAFQIEQLKQRHQTHMKDLVQRQKVEIFRATQNSQNSKRDMEKAHKNEIYHFNKHCVEVDTGVINGTFRGTQKLDNIQRIIKNE